MIIDSFSLYHRHHIVPFLLDFLFHSIDHGLQYFHVILWFITIHYAIISVSEQPIVCY